MKKYILGAFLSFSCASVMAQDIESLVFPDPLPVEGETIASPVQQQEQMAYTWADFLQGKSCAEYFNHLNTLDFISKKQQFLKDKMQAYCVGEQGNLAWLNLLNTFRQCKKNLLVSKTLKENGTFLGYIKALPHFLFDIHNVQPVGNSLEAKLDLIQNAIQNKEPEKILFEMQKLSAEDQLYLSSVFNEAGALADFQNALQGDQK